MPPVYTAADLIQLTKTTKSILLYGPAFTGKTTSLWTLAAHLKSKQLGKLHVFDLDLKCESLVVKCAENNLLDWLVVHRLGVKEDLTLGSARVGMNKDIFLEFQRQLLEISNQVEFTTGTWKQGAVAPGAIIGDSLSAYCDVAMQFILGSVGHQLGAAGSHAADDYGRAMAKILETVKAMKSLPCITGWIAHADLVQSGLDGKILRQPFVIGKKLAPQLAKEFNCTIYCPPPTKTGNKEHYQWQVHGGENMVESAGIAGKFDLPTFIEPDFRGIFA